MAKATGENHTVTADEIREQYKKFIGRKILFIFIFTALIVGITGVSTSLGSADLSVWDAYSSILRKPFPNTFESKYLFTYDDVPGSDGEKLLLYLSEEYGIGWAEGADISKSDDGMIITIVNGENSATITLDEDDAAKAELNIVGGKRSVNLEVKEVNGELHIHESTWLADVCVWNLRLPRIFLGIVAGIGLGIA
ncbi:MAG: hypothetical protein U9N12_10415, partial [Euryarchaeota archaeon]|nr:hypothetical protein [Euryarchaeota archaeon]